MHHFRILCIKGKGRKRKNAGHVQPESNRIILPELPASLFLPKETMYLFLTALYI